MSKQSFDVLEFPVGSIKETLVEASSIKVTLTKLSGSKALTLSYHVDQLGVFDVNDFDEPLHLRERST